MSLFIQQLKLQLREPLPGKQAQLSMVSEKVIALRKENSQNNSTRKSAVLILLYPFQNGIFTVLIERSIYTGVHSGQIAFPGGRAEEKDPDLKYTALRETYEEVGIPAEQIQIIGNLTDVYIQPSNFLVTPYIGYLPHSPDFKLNPREVQNIIRLDVLNTERIIKSSKKIMYSNGLSLHTPFYDVDGHTIWGATAMMMSEFIAIIEKTKIKLGEGRNNAISF